MALSGYLKQSTAVTVPIGPFVDATDGFTAETALTLSQADHRISKNGAAFAQKNQADASTHMENGFYSCAIDATDTNTLGRLMLAISEGGARPVVHEFMVLAANIFDSLIGGGDVLDVSVTQWLGTAAATPTVAGVPEVDATHWRGEAVPATSQTGVPKVDQSHLLGTAVATPTVAGVQEVDVTHWNGAAVATPTVAGVPETDVTHWLGTAAATPTVAGVPEVDVTHLGGSATSASDLKDFADDGYDPTTNLVAATATIGGLSAQAKADVNAEVVDALSVDTYAEPGQGTPAATASLAAKINYLYKNWRNRRTQTASQESLYNDDASTVDQKRTVSDDATTAGKTEWTTGP